MFVPITKVQVNVEGCLGVLMSDLKPLVVER